MTKKNFTIGLKMVPYMGMRHLLVLFLAFGWEKVETVRITSSSRTMADGQAALAIKSLLHRFRSHGIALTLF